MVYGTSNGPQDDIGNHLGPCGSFTRHERETSAKTKAMCSGPSSAQRLQPRAQVSGFCVGVAYGVLESGVEGSGLEVVVFACPAGWKA